ncbi:MAG: CBS domain-containing protein [Archangiaceae bacterium]|nr:CBS domain-containing protein [Archangiaceae bacterium]
MATSQTKSTATRQLVEPVLTVGELMSTNLLTLRDNASVGRAQAEMRLGRIRHFPVVDSVGAVVGIVSSHDIARALAVGGAGRSVPVKRVMTTQLQTVSAELPAYEAARLMRKRKISSLPVVNDLGALVGIVTATDFLEIAELALTGRALRRVW